MGGGDLNSKKSWHPNTMKNQERVWKAEQAAAEEKKRIEQLRHEHAQEKTREELKEMAKNCSSRPSTAAKDDRLHWMYNKPEKSVQQEDYLLGKEIEKNYDQSEKSDIIPAVARRVVGSSMMATASDTQVDLARKIREDPLLLVKERERAARAALLNNPLHRRRITELLKKEQEQKKLKEKSKKKKDLDSVLAEKLNALSADKNINLAALLGSDSEDSSSFDSDSKKKSKKKKKLKKEKLTKSKKGMKEKKSLHQSESDTNDSEDNKRKKQKQLNCDQESETKKIKSKDMEIRKSNKYQNTDSEDEGISHRKRKIRKREYVDHSKRSRHCSSEREPRRGDRIVSSERYKGNRNSPERYQRNETQNRNSPERSKRDAYGSRNSPDRDQRRRSPGRISKKTGLSDEEKAARLAEMATAGAERERERWWRVASERQREHDQPAPRAPAAPAMPLSLEERIHSNRHYIQRDKHHMSEHFARR